MINICLPIWNLISGIRNWRHLWALNSALHFQDNVVGTYFDFHLNKLNQAYKYIPRRNQYSVLIPNIKLEYVVVLCVFYMIKNTTLFCCDLYPNEETKFSEYPTKQKKNKKFNCERQVLKIFTTKKLNQF